MTRCAVLIPVYEPSEKFPELVRAIRREMSRNEIEVPILIVNDGCSSAADPLFAQVADLADVTIVRHALNLGKGAALKTGINAILTRRPAIDVIVTADGDGQHTAADIARVMVRAMADPSRLYLGVRRFARGVPTRSKFGHKLTAVVTRLLTGLSVGDTQTGLRGIPRDLAEAALRIPLNGHDFELECLIQFGRVREGNLAVSEVPIEAVCGDANRGSRFNPLLDSMRIYFVFLRYCAGSIATFLTDYAVFVFVFAQSRSIGLGIVLARTVAIFVSFLFNRRAVFRTRSAAAPAFARFVLLVAALGWISYLATSYLSHASGLSAPAAKLLVEAVLFFAGFALNNVFVFRRTTRSDTRTDWDDYYSRPYKAAGLTRRITANLLVRLMREHLDGSGKASTVLELGGANSCFVDALRKALAPREYHIVDNNRVGLSLSRERVDPGEAVFVHEADLLTQDLPLHADVTFSVGLIEHFDVAGTARLIDRHFDATRDGGLVIVTFPTATWLYRVIRRIAEFLRIWIFFDERPLSEAEVMAAGSRHGRLLHSRLNWAIGLTQRVMVFRREMVAASAPITSRAA